MTLVRNGLVPCLISSLAGQRKRDVRYGVRHQRHCAQPKRRHRCRSALSRPGFEQRYPFRARSVLAQWSVISLRGGIQCENWQFGSRKLQLLVEYFKGSSPNGQFYTQMIETIGFGAHLRY